MTPLNDITSKDQLIKMLLSSSNTSHFRETFWKNSLPVFYDDLLSWSFPDDFKFTQKVYHYINNDPDLLLGLCPECGRRCGFKNSVSGYHRFCSSKCATNSDEYREKTKETCLEKYGCVNPLQSIDIREKVKQTCLEKYGCVNPSQSEEIKEKKKETCLEKYGVDHYSRSDEYRGRSYRIREKAENTCLERYGVENPFQSEDVKSRIKDTCSEKYGKESYSQTDNYREKSKQTCLEKYGEEHPLQNRDLQEKKKETCLERYGKESYSQTDDYREKCYQTKKKNNTFNTSRIEDQLKKYFDLNNINYISQYKSDLYPFMCDFYFPDKDLYVEIQGSWTHGNHPFTGSEEDMNILESWKSKGTKYYDMAVETWSIRDVKKREKAKKNNLNYLEIFSCDLETCINALLQL